MQVRKGVHFVQPISAIETLSQDSNTLSSKILKLVSYRPNTKYGEGNVFTGICDTMQWAGTGGGGGVADGCTPPPRSMWQKTDGQQASDTHPTGVHSCYCLYVCLSVNWLLEV